MTEKKIYKWFWTCGSRNPVHENCAETSLHEPHNYLVRAWTSPGNKDYAICDGNQPGARLIPHGFGKAVAIGFTSQKEAEVALWTEVVRERKARLDEVLRKYPGTRADSERFDLENAERNLSVAIHKEDK